MGRSRAGRFEWLPGQSPVEVFGRVKPLFILRVAQGAYVILLGWAPIIEADMKRNASWRDRTGNARQTLAAFVFPEPQLAAVLGQISLVAKQHMSYGKWLELANAGKYAIVGPTLESYYSQVWGDFE